MVCIFISYPGLAFEAVIPILLLIYQVPYYYYINYLTFPYIFFIFMIRLPVSGGCADNTRS